MFFFKVSSWSYFVSPFSKMVAIIMNFSTITTVAWRASPSLFFMGYIWLFLLLIMLLLLYPFNSVRFSVSFHSLLYHDFFSFSISYLIRSPFLIYIYTCELFHNYTCIIIACVQRMLRYIKYIKYNENPNK